MHSNNISEKHPHIYIYNLCSNESLIPILITTLLVPVGNKGSTSHHAFHTRIASFCKVGLSAIVGFFAALCSGGPGICTQGEVIL